MSSRSYRGRGMQGHRGRRGGARVKLSSMCSMPNLETRETVGTPTAKMESQTQTLNGAELFRGVIGVAPTIAKYWLEATEHIMTDLDCTPTQKLRGPVSLFRDEAYQWWLIIEQGAQSEQVNWDYFKNAFQGKYVGTLVLSDYDKCVRFEEGLRYDLRVLINLQREWVFAILMDKAKIVEEVKHTLRERRDREKDQNKVKRDLGPSSFSQRPEKWASVGQTEAHQPALVYAARYHEESDKVNVIAGTFIIHSVLYYALIDIGSTQTYIANVVFVNLGLTAENTTRKFSVISPLGQSIRVDRIYRRVLLELQGTVFPASLMELPFNEFDLILGIDWLVEYQVSLDYVTKRVTLRPIENDEVVMVGDHRDYLSNVIFALVADKLVRKGCEAYLAYVSNSTTEKLSVGDIRTMKEFSDIFPEKFLEVPPDREMEFEIDLLPAKEIRVDPKKIEAVVEWKQLKNISELRSFLSLACYYRRFVEGFSLTTSPLMKLLRKNAPFVWSETQQSNSDKLKSVLT
ncbi:uncharacterized protein LOC108487862 [Gossypium arboreum]|uniref:uncharacterized protein LOC108487862 n=1 Tax=Gossypium arboreum TaxID=29729 RepID=UPI00081931F3|nr:uncharacterized protein LOC108487862 [Gossypium arboreum]